ncbi:MAG TPA: hypothetical protein VEX38_05595 [Fimbriimonadaceae bacterium]|nr:hypothetical protein [Fimbriimonadaceae bacterium]
MRILLALALVFSIGVLVPEARAGVLLQNPLTAKKDPFIGTFKGEDKVVEIKSASGGAYAIKATISGQSFDIKAKKVGDKLEGSFVFEGETFQFNATIENGDLVVTSDGERTVLTRVGGAAEAESAKNQEKPNPLTSKSNGKNPYAGWKIIKHPVGVSMRYPGDWTIRQSEDGYQLVPPGSNPDKEMYIVKGDSAEGLTDPMSQMFVAAIDQQVAVEGGGALKRKGAPKAARAGNGKGVLLVYEAQGPNGKVELRGYLTILKAYGVGIVALGDPDLLAKRADTLEKMFGTLIIGESEVDKELVGRWTKFSETIINSQSSGGRRPGDASLVGNHNTSVALNPDGSFTMRVQSHSIAGGSGVFIENKSDDTYEGMWAASDGKLILMWKDGSEEYTYRVEGNRVILRGATKEIVYQRG